MNTLLAKKALGQAIFLNNHGASLMEKHDHFNAIPTLKLALQACKEGFDYQDGESIDQLSHFSLDECLVWKCCSFSSSSVCVYQNAMRLPTLGLISEMDCDGGSSSNVVISTSIVFNLALSHHQAGLEAAATRSDLHHQEQARSLLCKAAKFYQMLFPLLQHPELQQPGCAVFAMVVLNNLGQLHQTLHEEEYANHYFRQLLSTLMYVVIVSSNNNISDDSSSSLPNEIPQFDFFFQSTSHLIFPKASLCASAA
jgi:hypothetical protein